MSSAAKRKGTSFESSVASWLRENGYPRAERRALAGVHDRGDIAGVPGVVFEAKNAQRHDLPGWLRELDTEMGNAGAIWGAVVIKRRGTTDAGQSYAVMTLEQLAKLLHAAGIR